MPPPFERVLDDAMKRRKVSVQELADCCGVNPSTVYKWLEGSIRPRPRRISTIADCLGISVQTLSRPLYEEAVAAEPALEKPTLSSLLERLIAIEEELEIRKRKR